MLRHKPFRENLCQTALEFCLFLGDHEELQPEPRCFVNTGVWGLQQMFALNFCEEEWIVTKVVNLVHESMFSIFWVTMQDLDLSQSL